MKFIRVNKNRLNEDYFKSVDKMKADLNKEHTADDIRKDAKKTLIDNNLELIDKLMVYWFVTPEWFAHSTLCTSCNLRPGKEDIRDYTNYNPNITGDNEKVKIEYLHKKVDFSVYVSQNNEIIVEIPFLPSSYPVDTLVITSNTFFNWLDKAEKCFEEYLKYPVKIKVRLEDFIVSWAQSCKIHYIKINQNVSFTKLIKFFKERVINPEIIDYDTLELRVLNRIDDTSFAELFKLGDFVKFDKVIIMNTSGFAARRFKAEKSVLCAKLKDINGIENLLRDPAYGEIHMSKIYFNNPEFNKNTEDYPGDLLKIA